jgi:D-beta-D-heptose 7-phosphate kinase/D-beta-D-heptose 1-phosphate adenosyltransferase
VVINNEIPIRGIVCENRLQGKKVAGKAREGSWHETKRHYAEVLMNIMRSKVVVAVSGGFDPVHIGHIRMFQEAKRLGDELVIILNNDHWLQKKKGFVFMPEKERAEILLATKGVDRVVLTDHFPHDTDRSVVRMLRQIRPNIFANGGDRESAKDIPEQELCADLGIEMVFGVGFGGKVQSSSWLTKNTKGPENAL